MLQCIYYVPPKSNEGQDKARGKLVYRYRNEKTKLLDLVKSGDSVAIATPKPTTCSGPYDQFMSGKGPLFESKYFYADCNLGINGALYLSKLQL